MTKTTGDIPMSDGTVFRWMLTGTSSPEIYGWQERDHSIVSHSGGWWRTDDPQEAARRCAMANHIEVAEEEGVQ